MRSHAKEERRGLWQAASVQNHRDLGRLCAGPMSRKYRNRCSSQLLHWYYALVLGALSSWPMMSGEGLLPCLGRYSLRPENGAESPRQVQSRHDLVCDQRQLRGRSPEVRCLTRLGAHTNLDWVRRVCVYFGVYITTAVIEREFMNVRQADQACTEPRGTHARGSMSVGGGRSREGQSTRMSVSFVPVSPHL